MQVIMHSEGFNFVLFHSVRKMKNSATISMKNTKLKFKINSNQHKKNYMFLNPLCN